MTADIELLPLPDIERYEVVGDIAYPINSDPNGDYVEYDGHVSAMADYARAVAEHNVKKRDAEIEALRALLLEACDDGDEADADLLATLERARTAEAKAERLAGLLDEVRSHFARDDDLPSGLLPRIDAALRDHDQEGKDG